MVFLRNRKSLPIAMLGTAVLMATQPIRDLTDNAIVAALATLRVGVCNDRYTRGFPIDVGAGVIYGQ